MTGDEQQFSSIPSRGNGTGFVQQLGGTDGAETLGQAEGEHGIGFKTEKRGVGVIVDGATGPVGKVSRVPDMVPVTVGQEERVRLELFFLQEVEETLRSINGEAVASQIDQIGVGGREAAAEAQRFGHEVGTISFRLGLGLGLGGGKGEICERREGWR